MPHPPQIPLTPQTNENNFPRWEGEKAAPGRPGARYPKMLTQVVTRDFHEDWVQKHRRVDQNTRLEYWEEVPPRVGSQTPLLTTQDMVHDGLASLANQPIIVNDQEEEERILEYLGLLEPAPKPQSVSIPIRATPVSVTSDDGWVSEPVKKRPPVAVAPDDGWIESEPVKKKRGRPAKTKPGPIDVGN